MPGLTPPASAAGTRNCSMGRARAVHSRFLTSRSCPRWHQFWWCSGRLPCYSIYMQVMARSVSLLLLVVALMLPTMERASACAEASIATQAAFVQSATPDQTSRMLMKCDRCIGKACDAYAATCGAYCGPASALAPLVVVVPASITLPVVWPSVSKAVRDHGRPPDPHPPRAIIIS